MKTSVTFALLAVMALHLTGCSTPEERARRDAKWEAERRQRDREDARAEGARSAEDWDDFLRGYARSLGKTTSELTASERADARREYNGGRYDRGGYYGGWGHHFWY